ncbi:hypothetical protein PUNSTDRAFT_91523 [Punctularia strigosozonata HHB-11173 SS5]|uniref:uncharacterized protein n=1 Tax=Punctularia strigosozonata (strain HHB-11173) TaxID=741275 RepID=UPI0004417FE5|nr:uncharacterized protein PUNSTDRAFT_91523 [Punctularia strigosozonata HHB-11173 SS5]EIN05886.1 hypothetical protein PUNSTDRAFT_91523 [Punctularia strigosozonata HHB-11173 SS5]
MERQERERSAHQEDHPADLTRMIGWLTATASEDWSLVLEVCERASSTPDNAREAIRALRKEFKYAEPPAQLSAARLLAIMLRNSSPTFLAHCSSRKFLDTLEDVLTSPRTNPVVRERLMDVLAGAAWMCSQELDNQVKEHPVGFWSEKDDFRSLWRRVRPADKPEQGIPFDTDDAMFNPPTPRRPSSFVQPPSHPPHDYTLEPYQPNADRPSVNNQTKPVQGHKPRNRIIPPDEDIRRLFQECKVGRGNAALLSEALAFAKPEDLKEKDVIKEFHHKCTASQEFIFAQIPWATATAERSRSNRGQVADGYERQSTADGQQTSITREEELLAELLFVNEELLAVLRVYDDLVRLGQERDAEERSRYDFRMDRAQLHREQQVNGYGLAPPSSTGAGSSRSPSPSLSSSPAFSSTIPPVIPSHAHPLPPIPVANANTNRAPAQVHGNTSPSMPFTYPHTLAPPHGPRHGPRSPMHRPARSRSPSLERPSVDSHTHSRTSSSLSGPPNGLGRLDVQGQSVYDGDSSSSEEVYTPMKPSEKALGKRRLEDPPTPERAQDEFFPGDPDDASQFEHYQEEARPSWSTPIHYVYDAAAERTEQRIRQGQAALVTGVR